MNRRNDWKLGVKNGLPIFVGYVAVSFAFGIKAQGTLTPLQAVIMSATNYTSAGQFAALELIAVSAGYLELIFSQLIINLRYFLMSCALSQKLDERTTLLQRILLAVGITDEVFGMTVSVEGRLTFFYALGVMTAALPGWVLGTLLGVIANSILPQSVTSALGLALYCMFISVVIPAAKGSKLLAGVIAVSMLTSAAFEYLPLLAEIPDGVKLIVLTLLIGGGAAALFPITDEQMAEESAAQKKSKQIKAGAKEGGGAR